MGRILFLVDRARLLAGHFGISAADDPRACVRLAAEIFRRRDLGDLRGAICDGDFVRHRCVPAFRHRAQICVACRRALCRARLPLGFLCSGARHELPHRSDHHDAHAGRLLCGASESRRCPGRGDRRRRGRGRDSGQCEGRVPARGAGGRLWLPRSRCSRPATGPGRVCSVLGDLRRPRDGALSTSCGHVGRRDAASRERHADRGCPKDSVQSGCRTSMDLLLRQSSRQRAVVGVDPVGRDQGGADGVAAQRQRSLGESSASRASPAARRIRHLPKFVPVFLRLRFGARGGQRRPEFRSNLMATRTRAGAYGSALRRWGS